MRDTYGMETDLHEDVEEVNGSGANLGGREELLRTQKKERVGVPGYESRQGGNEHFQAGQEGRTCSWPLHAMR